MMRTKKIIILYIVMNRDLKKVFCLYENRTVMK